MFILFESWKTHELVDRPDLGVSSILTALRKGEWPVKLMLGQTRYLSSVIRHMNEIREHFFELKATCVQKPFIEYFDELFENDVLLGEICDFQRNFSQGKRNTYFDVDKVMKLEVFFRNVMALYRYILDLGADSYISFLEEYKEDLVRYKPSYVGFSIYDYDPFTRAIRKFIKEEMKVPVIIGGPITHYIDRDQARQIFDKEYCDYIIVGPAEESLPKLLSCLETNGTLDKVPNLIYKKSNGQIFINEIEPVTDLNQLSEPDYSDYLLDMFYAPTRILPLQTSRGCSWRRCSFCSHHKNYHKYRVIKPSKVAKMIESLQSKYCCNHFTLHDEEISPVRLGKLSHKFIERRIESFFYCYSKFSTGFTSKIFDLAYQAGFRTICWGVESGSQRVLDRMNKGFNIEVAAENLRMSKEQGIANICWVMFGFPGETEDDRMKTIEFLEANRSYIDLVNISYFKLTKESPISEDPLKWGIDVIPNENYWQFNIATRQDDANLKFIKELAAMRDVGVYDFTSEYKYVPDNNLARLLIFYLACHRVSSHGTSNQVYPLLIGDLKNESVQDYTKSYFLNAMFEAEIDLHSYKECFQMLDGTVPLAEILQSSEGKEMIKKLEDINSLIYLNKSF